MMVPVFILSHFFENESRFGGKQGSKLFFVFELIIKLFHK